MSLKKVRGGVTGFGDTLVSKTCRFFFRVSRKGRGWGGRYIWYSTLHNFKEPEGQVALWLGCFLNMITPLYTAKVSSTLMLMRCPVAGACSVDWRKRKRRGKKLTCSVTPDAANMDGRGDKVFSKC